MLFFPGLAARANRLSHGIGQGGRKRVVADRSFEFDHATLEADRATWHITQKTGKRRADHQGGARTTPVGEGRIFWFGLIAADLSEFRPLASRTIARAECPPNDAEVRRRLEAFDTAVGHSEVATIPLPAAPSDHVLFMNVVVGPVGAPDFEGPLHLPGPLPAAILRPASVVAAKHASVRLGVDTRVQFVVAWLPGTCGAGLTLTWTQRG